MLAGSRFSIENGRQTMKRILLGLAIAAASTLTAPSQSIDDLNIQFHGYATQGFLYSTANNFFTTKSSNGSPAWDEAVVNLTAQPTPKLRIGVQARYFLLGNLGNAITLDWAAADYKASDLFGARFGKVKTPSGLFNDIQDIDPSYQWALLPQTIYPLMSRNSLLAHYGGVVYGISSWEPRAANWSIAAGAVSGCFRAPKGTFSTRPKMGLHYPMAWEG